MSTTPPVARGEFRGTNSALLGIVLGVITFWLFAQTTLNIGPAIGRDLGTPPTVMNMAISASALFAGMFIVVAGGLGDRFGRVRMVTMGNMLGIAGCLFVGLAFGPVANGMLLVGRVLQGLSAAFIMPSTLALIKTYWKGTDRQRAVSMWSIGSWGGTSVSSFLAGVMASSFLGWRSIFLLGALVSTASILLMRQIPEDAPARGRHRHQDWPGTVSLAIFVLTLLLLVTQASAIGWPTWRAAALIATCVAAGLWFIAVERGNPHALVDFSLFTNPVYTGATVSNFLANATAGLIPVSMWVVQDAATMTPAQTGYLTIGYAVFLIGCIRVGERFLLWLGPRRPMAYGLIVVTIAVAMLMMTNVDTNAYVVMVIVGYCLFGFGLALYATPSTDTALGSLPDEKAGAGSGVYKMASSLGAAFGVAIPTSIFTAIQASGSGIVSRVVDFSGRQDNLAIREAGMVAMGSVLIMALVALISVWVLIPKKAGETVATYPDSAEA